MAGNIHLIHSKTLTVIIGRANRAAPANQFTSAETCLTSRGAKVQDENDNIRQLPIGNRRLARGGSRKKMFSAFSAYFRLLTAAAAFQWKPLSNRSGA
jgi:hypothetical protein